MAQAYLEMTAASVCRAVEAFSGSAAAGAALAIVQAGYMRFLGAWPWTFLRPVGSVTIPQYATGTASGVYDAGDGETTITATAAIFYPWHVGLDIVIADVGTLAITSYTSCTVAVAGGGEDFVAKAISVQDPAIVDMPADFGGLAGDTVYAYSATQTTMRVEPVTPEELLAMWRDSNTPGTPRYFALAPKAGFTGAAPQAWQMLVAPRPDADRIWYYRYHAQAPDITDSTACHFLGGPIHSLTIRDIALAEAEAQVGHVEGGPHARRAQASLAASVRHDQTLLARTRPQSFGTVRR